MAALNTGSGVAARNGTTSHTINFGFTSTTGSLLVFVIAGSVTHAATGWTERLSPVNAAELSVFTKTSTGDSSITVTHNAANYPANWYVWEWVAGSTWVNGAQATANSNTFPALGSLPGTAVELGAAYCASVSSTGGSASSTWTAGSEGWAEVYDTFTADNGTTDGIYMTVATASAFTGTTTTPAGTFPSTGVPLADNRQKVVWAIAEPGGSSATVTPATVAVVVALDTPTITAASTVAPAEVTVTAASPQASVSAAATITPATVTLTTAVDNPTITAGATVTPDPVAATVALDAPTVAAGATVAPAEVTVVAALGTATIDVTAAATATPDPVAVAVTLDTPTISVPATVTPDPVAATATLPTPTIDVSGAAVVTPATVELTVGFPQPTITAGWVTTPDPVTVTVDVPAPTVTLAATATPATVTVGVGLDTPTYTAAATVQPATLEATVAVPTPALDAVLSAFFYYEAGAGLTGDIGSGSALVGAVESGGGV